VQQNYCILYEKPTHNTIEYIKIQNKFTEVTESSTNLSYLFACLFKNDIHDRTQAEIIIGLFQKQ